MSRHAPGPWSWGWIDDDGEVLEADKLLSPSKEGMAIYFEPGGPATATDVANKALIAAAPTMLAILEELEWSLAVVTMDGALMTCPCCHAFQDKGYHLPWCRLGALLGELRGPAHTAVDTLPNNLDKPKGEP